MEAEVLSRSEMEALACWELRTLHIIRALEIVGFDLVGEHLVAHVSLSLGPDLCGCLGLFSTGALAVSGLGSA